MQTGFCILNLQRDLLYLNSQIGFLLLEFRYFSLVTLTDSLQFLFALLLKVCPFFLFNHNGLLLLLLQRTIFVRCSMMNWDSVQIEANAKEVSVGGKFRFQPLCIKHLLFIHHLADGILPTRFVLGQPFIERTFPTGECFFSLCQFLLKLQQFCLYGLLFSDILHFCLLLFHLTFSSHGLQIIADDYQLTAEFLFLSL